MSCILHIETSTSACSVAVSEDGQNVFKKEDLNVKYGRYFGRVVLQIRLMLLSNLPICCL